jgi:N-acyl-phosphatidylethanolamine-hydrolysing phospholipase D
VRLAAILLPLVCLGAAAPLPDTAALYAEHRRDGAFFNPWEPFDWSFFRFLRWRFSRNAFDKSRAPEIPWVRNDGASLAGRERSGSVVWVGHATVAVHDDDDVFLTDPHFGERALLPRRVVPPGIPLASVPGDAFAVVSHNHYDHLDRFTVEQLPDSIEWYVPLGLAEWFRARGRERVVELDWWQSAVRGRWTITCLPAQHWSRRIEQGTNSSLWCAWLLDSGARRYFFAGDTGYFAGFAEFGRRFGPIDLALLPIGAYEPRWFMRYQHMNPEEAYAAFRDLGARYMLGLHWGTFDLTDEPLDLPPRALREAVAAAKGDDSRVKLLAIGERWRLPEREAP